MRIGNSAAAWIKDEQAPEAMSVRLFQSPKQRESRNAVTIDRRTLISFTRENQTTSLNRPDVFVLSSTCES